MKKLSRRRVKWLTLWLLVVGATISPFVCVFAEWVAKRLLLAAIFIVTLLVSAGCVTWQDFSDTPHDFTLEAREGVHYRQWEGWHDF
jgi:hypothetical protein